MESVGGDGEEAGGEVRVWGWWSVVLVVSSEYDLFQSVSRAASEVR